MTDYTLNEVEAAMCIWEHALHCRRVDEHPKWLRDEGAAANRTTCMHMAPAMETAYQYAVTWYGYDDPFDWEFVPLMLDGLGSPIDAARFALDPEWQRDYVGQRLFTRGYSATKTNVLDSKWGKQQ
jgi:hypothetical protein